MGRSDYEIVGTVIRDLNKGNMSVTNDAEAVVAELGGRVFYFDSDGHLDELVHDHGVFKGFKSATMTVDAADDAIADLIIHTLDTRSNHASLDGHGTVCVDGRELRSDELRALADIIDAVGD